MPRLSGVRLSVPDPADLAGFYTRFLGMRATDTSQGLRVGYALASAEVISWLKVVGAPYAVSALSLAVADKASAEQAIRARRGIIRLWPLAPG